MRNFFVFSILILLIPACKADDSASAHPERPASPEGATAGPSNSNVEDEDPDVARSAKSDPALPPFPQPHPEVLPCGETPEDMVCIPGGPFIRGADDGPEDARPQAVVWVQTFYMDKNEVTFQQYQECAKTGRCDDVKPLYRDFDAPDQPMNGASWFHAKKYCEAQGKTLPTEAQWEKAARGTDGRLYPWGNEPATCERAVIKDESGRSCGVKKKGQMPDKGKPWPIASKPPQENGLYDMAGNSWEWVLDWHTESYAACGEKCTGVDPKGPCDGEVPCKGHREKVVRGGSWYWEAEYATTIHRRAHVANNNPVHHFGFRCAISAPLP